MARVRLTRDEQLQDLRMLYFYRRHPCFAARDIAGVRLAPHQRVALRVLWYAVTRYDASEVVLWLSRRLGKTFLVALRALLDCSLYVSKKHIFIGAGGFRQAKRLIKECSRIVKNHVGESQTESWFLMRSLIDRRGSVADPVVKQETDAQTIEFKNGNMIRAIPIGHDGDRIRGEGGTDVIVDEAKDLDPDIEGKVIRPFVFAPIDPTSISEAPPARYVKIGTVEFEDDEYTQRIYRILRSMEEGKPTGIVVEFDYRDTFWRDESGKRQHWGIPYRIRVDEIEKDRDSGNIPLEDWAAENINRPIRSTGNYFPSILIRRASSVAVNPNAAGGADEYLVPKLSSNDPVVWGVDVGKAESYFALTIVRVGELAEEEFDPVTQEGKTSFNNVVYAMQMRGRYRDYALRMTQILEFFPNTLGIWMDGRGGGAAVADELAFNLPDHPPIYDREAKDYAGKVAEGMPILHILMPSDILNTKWNSFLLAQLQRQKLLFPKTEVRVDNKELEEVHRAIRMLTHQLTKVQVKKTQNALKFDIPGKAGRRKDLYSSLVYAAAGLREVLLGDVQQTQIESGFAWVPM